jgi:hypothetical protein
MATIVVSTAAEAIAELSKMPPNARFVIYNNDAMKHTPVSLHLIEAEKRIFSQDTIVVESAVHVTVEDYD